MLVLVRGAGDLATGVAWRLFRCGFPVVMTEVEQPLAVRRGVAFSEAVALGAATVEGITARLAADPEQARVILYGGEIPVLVDPEAASIGALTPRAVVDATMTKRPPQRLMSGEALVIGLGPGFTAGHDCDAVVETQRGHSLGRVYYQGNALPDTGIPAERGGQSMGRVVRAPAAGVFRTAAWEIGEKVQAGDLLGHIGAVPVHAASSGLLRGLLRDGTAVTPGLKLGDVDPAAEPAHCFTLSDKALAVAGGVLEALLVLGRKEVGPSA